MKRLLLSRRQFSRMAGLGAAAAALPHVMRAGASGQRPNVLFILTDDQREDTIAALGNPHIQTPNLDGLVRSGVRFSNAYCMGGFVAAVCLPARMMTLRGRSWFSVRNQPPDAPNFPKSMNEAGYLTYFMGKSGNTDKETQKQFTYCNYVAPNDNEVRLSGRPDEYLADQATSFLRKWKSDPSTSQGKPFFMYLAGASPHDPRVAPKEYLDRYDPNKIPLPPNFQPYHRFNNGELLIRDEQLAPWPRTETEIRRHLRDYYAVITFQDEQFGRIFRTLKEIGEYDNTIIIFSSDQGIAIGSHGLMGKQNLYEHSMGAPLIFSGPGIPKGKTVDAFCYHFDIYPTVCDLVGAQIPGSLEGKSLAPVLRGQTNSVRDTIFLAYRDVQRAVRRGPWKLIRYPEINRTQLFNLDQDPYETKDLSGDPANSGRIRDLMDLMRGQQKLYGDTAPLTSEDPKPGDVGLEFFKQLPQPAAKDKVKEKRKKQ
jgi:arylsulfatase A-like enzyme